MLACRCSDRVYILTTGFTYQLACPDEARFSGRSLFPPRFKTECGITPALGNPKAARLRLSSDVFSLGLRDRQKLVNSAAVQRALHGAFRAVGHWRKKFTFRERINRGCRQRRRTRLRRQSRRGDRSLHVWNEDWKVEAMRKITSFMSMTVVRSCGSAFAR